MSSQEKELYEFGPFRIDPEKRLLLRDNQPVPLQLKAFETLLMLVRHSEQVVLKDEIMKAVWPDTFVEESNLTQNIFVLRKTLGAIGGDHPYIVTIPGRGYRFSEKVRLISEDEALVLQRRSRTHVVIDEVTATESAPAPAAPVPLPAPRPRPARLRILLAVALVVAIVAAVTLRPVVPPPRVTRIRQITHLGTLIPNTRLLTDGPRIYFRAWQEKDRVFRSVSTEGGEVSLLEKPMPEVDIDDLSNDHSEFLEVNLVDRQRCPGADDIYPTVWRVPVPSGSPRPVPGVCGREVAWAPDGSSIALARDNGLYLANPDGTNSREVASLPDTPIHFAWSPDGKSIRFSVADPKGVGADLWQADVSTSTVQPVIPGLSSLARPWSGAWTSDGRYFIYTAINDGTRNVWAIREKPDLFRRFNPQPVQLTNGPLSFSVAIADKDGKRLFVVGDQPRGQLVHYDGATQQFSPYAQGISADQVAFSRDGQWMAYVEFPEGALVRSRLDGTGRRQLTFPPMRAFNPQWSPDGTQIAFHASAQMDAYNKIYLVSTNGGVPSPATPGSSDRQTCPSWISDGSAILFSSADASQSNVELHILDLKTNQASTLPGTSGLHQGQISPDGHNVIATNRLTHELVVYETASHGTRTLADIADYPRWSDDGKFVYFLSMYFNPKGRKGGVYRWSPSTNAIETIFKYPQFLLTGAWGVTFSVTPDGAILLLRDTSNRDLYTLDVDLP
jgi:DNA-binding winged helix-turn-helix (wHTH) protein/Tol biopolymer transport system component